MDLKIEFNNSAFKHGITEQDIIFAIDTAMYDACIEKESNYGKND